MENRVRYKIGEIEFEAEGSVEILERERNVFLNTILPAAVDAIMRTRSGENSIQYIETLDQSSVLLNAENIMEGQNDLEIDISASKNSRTSLASFLITYGNLTEQDFVLFSAYYDEMNNKTKEFSSENVKNYYAEARRTEYSNVSMLIRQLVKKGLIMDAPDAEKKTPKLYIVTQNGIDYIGSYQAKENGNEKPKTVKARKARNKVVSKYSSLNADELNLNNYPQIKGLSTFKKQMIMLLHIINQEDKGDTFSVGDIQYLMTDMLGLPASIDQINGIFNKNKSWFKSEKDPNNKKAYQRKLLQGAKDFAQAIIAETKGI